MTFFNYRKGSVERGQVWDNIANRLNVLESPKLNVNQHYLWDKLNKLLKWFKKKDREELSSSGIDPELDEKSEILEEIVEKMESTVPVKNIIPSRNMNQEKLKLKQRSMQKNPQIGMWSNNNNSKQPLCS